MKKGEETINEMKIKNEKLLNEISLLKNEVFNLKNAQKLAKNDQLLIDAALDAQVDTFFLFDPAAGKAIRWNKAFREVSGYTDEEIKKQAAPSSYYSPEDLKKAQAFIEEVLEKKTGVIELDLICKDGTKIPTEYKVSVIDDETGTPPQIISMGRDITQRKSIERELRNLNQFQESIVQNANVWLNVLDEHANVIIWNSAAEVISGYSKEDVVGHNKIWEWCYPDVDYRNEITARANEIIAENEVLEDYETTIRCKDGSDKIISWNSQNLKNENGKIIGSIALGRDITDKKVIELELKESEERLKTAGMAAYDLIYEWDVNSDSLKWFGEIDTILGYKKGEISHNLDAWISKIHKDDIGMIRDAVDVHRTSTEPIHYEYRIKHKNGKFRYWTDHALPLLNEKGKPYKWVGVCTDVTDHKLAEKNLLAERMLSDEIIQSLPGLFYIFEKNSTSFFRRNKNWSQITAYTDAELDTMTALDMVVDRDLCAERIKEVFDKGFATMENLLLTKSGDTIPYFFTGGRIHIDDKTYLVGVGMDISERINSEENLRKNKAHLQTLIETIPDMMWMKDPDGVYLTCNHRFEEFFGASEKEIVGKTDYDFVDKELGDFFRKHDLAAIAASEPTMNEEEVVFASDGHHEILETVKTPMYDTDGNLIGVLGIARDITERKKIEEVLQESEEYYRTLIENSSDVVSILDAAGNITYESPSHKKVLGYKKDELLGENAFNLVHPDDLERVSKQFTNLLKESKGIENISFRFKHKNGEWMYIEGTGTNLLDTPKINGIVVNYRDVTERKHAELVKAVMHKISSSYNITESLDELIAVIRKELGALMDTTNFFVAIYDEEIDSIMLPYIADKNDTHTSFPAGKSYTGRVIKDKQSILIRKDELVDLVNSGEVEAVGTMSEVWLGVPMIIEGKVTGAIVVQSYDDKDAYDLKDMEILEFVSQTIGISIERKRAEQNLINALEKATESDRLKSAFLATMSHELRTPLNAIIGFSDIINDELPVEDIIKFNKNVNNSGKHLLSIVEDLFDITMIESGEIRIDMQDVNVSNTLSEIHEIIRSEQFKSHKDELDILLKIPREYKDLVVKTDKLRLKQIIINLLKNALKFTIEGSISYGFSLEEYNQKKHLQFYVKDTGIGIAKEKRKFIFDVFRQVEDSYTREFGGTGIGLSISKKLTSLLGGEIWLESEVAKGSTFYFTIPVQLGDVEQTTNIKPPIRKVISGSAPILIVEDDESSYEFIHTILEKENYVSLWAKNGEEAISLCENNKISIILMDINMPVMNGLEATKIIKRKWPEIPIIAQTAYAIVGDKEKALEAGCDDYISKPIKRLQLIAKINSFSV